MKCVMMPKKEMKALDETKLGSWKQAVTCADGVWQTRGYHSKNGTFSVRNYMNGALLFYKHLCQKGSDDVIQEDLYQGTSKSMEGYAAREIMSIAKEEGMNIAVQWQDSDASSAKHIKKCFPDCQVMICGGHAGKNHLKTLQSYAKIKCPSKKFIDEHVAKFPLISSVTCHCKHIHKSGCGCLSNAFIIQSRNHFSFFLKDSQSPDEFAKRLKSLPKHACDIHTWTENGKAQCCEFHPLHVCSCGKCKKGEEITCKGKPYTTRYNLTCKFHSLMYEIECDYRASMANSLIHPVLKRGHTNWLEASHSVMIRFRSKDVALERLHYEISTNLAFLQSNMTYMWQKRGKEYHWIPDLYKRLGLPLYEGMEEAYTKVNVQRKRGLDKVKENKAKRRRIQLYKMRTEESLRRKEWTRKHGSDSYDTSGCGNMQRDDTNSRKSIKNEKKFSHETVEIFADKKIDIPDTDNLGNSSDDSFEHEYESYEGDDEDEVYYDSFSEDAECQNDDTNAVEIADNNMDEESAFVPDGNQYCTCRGEETLNMVECDGPKCAIGWFHFECVGLSGPPTTNEWYCNECLEKSSDTESPIVITKVSREESVTISGPLPTEEWKSMALEYIATRSKMRIEKQSQRIRKVSCSSIVPHIRDSVMGDGNCLFRAISKAVSNTEANHLALRIAMVNFMIDKDNAFLCARSIRSDDKSLSEPIDAMKRYIEKNRLDKNGWGTDHEIHIIASMLQVCIYVNGLYGEERKWVKYKPLFQNFSCMAKNDFKIFIYHNVDHYDNVVPVFQ